MTRRAEVGVLAVFLTAAVAVRAAYVAAMGLPVFDPWRHLLLLESLRSGRGFTLFEGQRYVWYDALWYRLCALLPRAVGMEAVAAVFSALAAAAVWAWLRREGREESREEALAAALLVALFGPFVAFTCHYGSEGFAIALVLASAAVAARSGGALAAAGAGLLLGAGLAARLNLAFDALLLAPFLRRPARVAAAAGGAAVPLAALWLRNRAAIGAYPFLFTWDGLATPASGFNAFSTLFLQAHPSIGEGLRRLHEQIVPFPEWISGPDGIAWGPLVFMAGGALCVLACRRLEILAAWGATALYLLVLDRTRSSNFFRIWLGTFPLVLAAFAIAFARLRRSGRPALRAAAWPLLALPLVAGAGFLKPLTMYPLELVTPPPALLTAERYMVNSTFYHPESLMARFPDKRFVGLPLRPEEFEAFHARYPEYRTILWHDFGVQDDLLLWLVEKGGWRETARAANDFGRRYVVLEETPSAGPPSPPAGEGAAEGRSTR